LKELTEKFLQSFKKNFTLEIAVNEAGLNRDMNIYTRLSDFNPSLNDISFSPAQKMKFF